MLKAYCHAVFSVTSVNNKRFSSSSGVTLLEFAIVFPLIILLLGGIVDWSIAIYARHLTLNATRSASRVAAVTAGFPDNCVFPSANPACNIAKLAYDQVIPSGSLFGNYQVIIVRGNLGASTALEAITTRSIGVYNTTFLRAVGFPFLPVESRATVYYEG